MKELYVSASLYYGFTVNVPDNFDFTDESAIMDIVNEANPIQYNLSNIDNPETYFNSVYNINDNILYNWV